MWSTNNTLAAHLLKGSVELSLSIGEISGVDSWDVGITVVHNILGDLVLPLISEEDGLGDPS